MRTPTEHIKTLQRRIDFLKSREHINSFDKAEIGSLEWALVNLQPQRKPLTMQPIIKDERGVLRFKKNGLVDVLYEHGVNTGLGLNELHCMNFTDEDRQQFAQLIGYSVSGYGSLSYVTDEAYEAAEKSVHGIKEQP